MHRLDVIAGRMFRRLRRASRPLSRAELLRRRSARIEALARKEAYKDRALAVLHEFARNRGLRRTGDPAQILGALFERDAGRIARIAHYTRTLEQMGLTPRSAMLAPESLAFVRGCLAFHRHEFGSAAAAFAHYARNFPDTRAAAAARDVARWLDAAGFTSPAVLRALSDDRAGKRHGSTLVVAQGAGRMLSETMGRLGDKPDVLLLVAAADVALQSLPARRRILLDGAFWQSAEGAALLREFGGLNDEFWRRAATPRNHFAEIHGTLSTLAASRALPAAFLVAKVAALVRRQVFSRIVVVTAWPALYEAIVEAAKTSWGTPVPEAAWIARPRLAAGSFSYWPASQTVENAFQALRSHRFAVGRKRWCVMPAILDGAGADVAIVAVSGADSALVPEISSLVRDLLRRAPVLILGQLAPDLLAQLQDSLAGLQEDRPHRAQLYPAAIFEAPNGVVLDANFTVAARAALQQACAWHGRTQTTRALCEVLLARGIGAAPEVAMLAATAAWLDAALRGRKLVVMELRGERTVWLAGVAEFLAGRREPVAIPAKKGAEASRSDATASPAPQALLEPNLLPRWERQSEPAAAHRDPRERAAFAAELAGRGKQSRRAEALLIALHRRHGLERVPQIESLLPALFDDNAFDLVAMTRLAAQARGARLPRADPAFGFVRGTLALWTHDFARAENEMSAFAAHSPNSQSGVAARDIADWLAAVPYSDPVYANMLRSSESIPDMRRYRGKKLLVITEATDTDAAAVLSKLPDGVNATIVYRFVHDQTATPPRGQAFRFPGRYLWYEDHGKALHKHLERICEAATDRINAASKRFRQIPWSLRTFLIDRFLYDYVALATFAEEFAKGDFDAALIVTRRYSFYQTAREIARARLPARRIAVAWIARPSLKSAPYFVYWPSKALLKALLLRKTVKHKADKRLGRPLAAPLPTIKMPPVRGTARPAVVVWSLGDKNYEIAVERLIKTILPRRPVILMAMGDTDGNVARLQAALAPAVRSSGNAVQILRYDSLLRDGRRRHSGLLATARDAVAKTVARSWFRAPADPLLAAVTRFDLAAAFVPSPHIAAMASALDWLDSMLAAVKPAYAVSAPGRNPFPAAVCEYLAAKGIESADLHLFFLADSARQMQPPQRYIGVIDSEMAKFVENHWKVPPEHILRVGYVWDDSAHNLDAASPEAAESNRQTLIVYATQPSPAEILVPFFSAVLDALAQLPEALLIVKPHPREEPSAVNTYAAIAKQRGLANRVEVVPRGDAMSALLDRATLVVTRTSNVGLEAAQRLKPVVRGVIYDQFLPTAFLEVPYALNALTEADLIAKIQCLAEKPSARAALRAQQKAYFAANPSLIDGRGLERLVAFLEKTL